MERRYLLNSITLTCLFVAISDECDTMKMKNNKQSKQKVWEGRPRYGDIYRERTDRAGGEKSKAHPLPARRAAPHLRQGRMQRGRVRHLPCPHRRQGDEGLRSLDGQAGGKDHPYGRGPFRLGEGRIYLRLRQGRRGAVRLLHPGHGHLRQGAAGRESRADARGGCVCHPQQHLPLHGLCEDHRRHSARSRDLPQRQAAGGEKDRLWRR